MGDTPSPSAVHAIFVAILAFAMGFSIVFLLILFGICFLVKNLVVGWFRGPHADSKSMFGGELRASRCETKEERKKKADCEERFFQYGQDLYLLGAGEETHVDVLLDILPDCIELDGEFALTHPDYSGPSLADKIMDMLGSVNKHSRQ